MDPEGTRKRTYLFLHFQEVQTWRLPVKIHVDLNGVYSESWFHTTQFVHGFRGGETDPKN